MKKKYESLGVYRKLIVLLFLAIGIWYLHWRIPTLAKDAPIFSAILYGAEIYGFFTAVLHLLLTWRLTIRESLPPPAGASVDVFIPTYNESVDLVRKTVLAALHMDYPHETWLLDDGNRPEMQALAERLGVHYIARTENTHAKAGNLNNALAQTKGEFIAIFDADHAPQRNFLTATLGYFKDPLVALVQTPQDFFNLDSYQHRWNAKKKELWTEQALFFKVLQRGKDYFNSAFFCGSCAVVRRSSLEKIGGIATETVTEDLHTSVKLHKAGFKTVYHAESLAFGIAPGTVAPFLKQRVRWAQGAMQTLRKENIIFTTKLTTIQKLSYLASMLTYLDGWQKGIFYISPVIVLVFGIMPIWVEATDFLIHFLPYYILSFVVFEEVGRGYGGTLFIEQYNFARFAAFAWGTLGLFIRKLRFEVTAKACDRSLQSKQSKRMFLPQFSILLLNMAAIPVGLLLSMRTQYLPLEAVAFNVGWAVLNCALALTIFRFTQKTGAFLRDEYRFPIPLPVSLLDHGRHFHGTIDNISTNGCRIYARLPEGVGKGAILAGTIHLPSGELPFEAEIVSEIRAGHGPQTYVKAVGCRFHWSKAEHQDALDLFLYGNNLQWKLLAIKEAAVTPIQWLMQRLRRERRLEVQVDERWATIMLSEEIDAGRQLRQFGLVPLQSDGRAPRQVVVFQQLELEKHYLAGILTRTGQSGMLFQVQAGAQLENSAGSVYLYRLSECRLAPDIDTLNTSVKAEPCAIPCTSLP